MPTHPTWIRFGSRSSSVWSLLVPLAPGVLATTGVLALLLAFQQVVASSVENSHKRHRANAEHAAALWRCNSVRVELQRSGCLAQLEAVAP
jgi:hypothetical protein